MPDREELLVSMTGKGQYADEIQRIYNTIIKKKPDPLTTHKTTFILASLLHILVQQNVISVEELDQMLLDCL